MEPDTRKGKRGKAQKSNAEERKAVLCAFSFVSPPRLPPSFRRRQEPHQQQLLCAPHSLLFPATFSSVQCIMGRHGMRERPNQARSYSGASWGLAPLLTTKGPLTSHPAQGCARSAP
ncbi:UNVERIFIED_CONTAM: hypothetical protein K2H54_073527 [Gekko kuhli]